MNKVGSHGWLTRLDFGSNAFLIRNLLRLSNRIILQNTVLCFTIQYVTTVLNENENTKKLLKLNNEKHIVTVF